MYVPVVWKSAPSGAFATTRNILEHQSMQESALLHTHTQQIIPLHNAWHQITHFFTRHLSGGQIPNTPQKRPHSPEFTVFPMIQDQIFAPMPENLQSDEYQRDLIQIRGVALAVPVGLKRRVSVASLLPHEGRMKCLGTSPLPSSVHLELTQASSQGDSDEFGALNHTTNATILAAKNEIKTGRVFNLNLELGMPDLPLNPSRPALIHTIQPFAGYQDDVLRLNTQISTQFDGLRHFPYSTNSEQSTFYNDLVTFDEIVAAGGSSTLGIQNAARKGITGRGVLLDWGAWMDSKNATYDAFRAIPISTAELDAVVKWQELNPPSFTKPGYFLIVRTGFIKQYLALSPHEQAILPHREESDAQWLGVEASDATLCWLWKKKLLLVGSENPAFESVPFNGTIEGVPRALHQVLIGGWGQSIIELLDLEKLAAACQELKRYSFFSLPQRRWWYCNPAECDGDSVS
ncbi:hypothetical protein DFH09DRAFT_1270369 [Mycena vulgaris]|nr:hypothetical protein DFH09DRAFT_1270369 [Mycena vulgaris]